MLIMISTAETKPTLINLMLWAAVIASALLVVWSTHQSREQHAELMRLQMLDNQLQVEYGQYLLQEGALASPGRVEQIARDRLQMRIPEMFEIRVLRK